MKIYTFLALAIILLGTASCNINNDKTKKDPQKQQSSQVKETAFEEILEWNNVNGAILIYDFENDTYYSNDFEHCNKGFLPASTFKIANSIIGLEIGVINKDTTIFYWDGKERGHDIWEQDLNFHDAFHYSCVPCYQKVARNIGVKRMNEYLDKLDYGKMHVDSSNIDIFWLEGDSKITQFEQIDFLKRLYFEELQVSEQTMQTMKEIMVLESDDYYSFSGKTGWVTRNGENTGWFVGYYEMNDKVWFVATNIQPTEGFNMDLFPVIRKEISLEAIYHVLAETEEFIYFEF